MPPSAPLPQADIDVIRQWITDGVYAKKLRRGPADLELLLDSVRKELPCYDFVDPDARNERIALSDLFCIINALGIDN